MIRKNPAYDTEHPAGQIASAPPSAISWPYPPVRMKRLGDIIDQTLRNDAADNASKATTKEIYDAGYADGWRDAAAKYGVW